MTSPAASRGHEVRQRLLTAAVELISERGWTAVSTRVLAARAGVTPSVVHYHFASVRALMNEAALGVLEQVLTQADAFLETALTPVDAVDALLASVARYTGNDPTSLLAIEAYLAATRDDELREQIARVVEQFRLRFGRWLGEHGVPEADTTAAVLVAAVDGLLLHRGLGSDLDAEALASVLRRVVS